MNSLFEELQHVLPPPSRPLHATGDWSRVEAEIGTSLPDDYKLFISVYGQGKICKSLWIDNYLSCTYNETATDVINSYLRQYEDIRKIGIAIPYALYPNPDGLLPFGGIENGGAINWRRTGAPNDWDIVVWQSDWDHFYLAQNMSLIPFLLELVTQRWEHFSQTLDPEAFECPSFVPCE